MLHTVPTFHNPTTASQPLARLWMGSGAADRILAAIIAENATRRALAVGLLGGRKVPCARHSPYLWLDLPGHWRPGDFTRELRDIDVKVAPGRAFAVDRRANDQGVRIAFGGPISRAGLEAALRGINTLLDETPDHEFRTVA